MEPEFIREVRKLLAGMRANQASEITVYALTVEALCKAIGARDWQAVVEVKDALNQLAADLTESIAAHS